jgi:hypothetical protein
MNTLEKFYRTPDGKIVFNALASVGAEQSFSCAHLHGYRDNGFPAELPVQSAEENIWAAFSGMTQLSCAAE